MEYLGKDPVADWQSEEVVPGGEVILWDDDVHERLESKQLFFWRLAFTPKYPRDKVFAGLAAFYEEAKITSYVAYETLGDFDLLLRVWAPRTHNTQELNLMLRQNLAECHLWDLNYLACRTESHFARNGDRERASIETLQAVSTGAIGVVNDYNSRQWRRHIQQGPGDRAELARPQEVDQLLKDQVARPVPLDTKGIRMFITFDHPRQPFREATERHVIKELEEKCEVVRDSWRGLTETLPNGDRVEISLPNISIYAGAGSQTDFLIMARAPHKYFHKFVRQLIFGIRDIGLDERYEMRPYTHVIADRMFSEFSERRDLGGGPGRSEEMIDSEEDESLELKATLATNFRSLIMADRHEADPAMLDEVVRAVCGMLNSPTGGTVVIGVLEVKRELEKARNPERYLQALEQRFEYSPVDAAGERTYPNAAVGIEVDLNPGPFADVDAYRRHLKDTLKSRINPNPWLWIRADLEEVAGKTICTIRVRPGDVWFYAKVGEGHGEEFFVREGAATVSLVGPAGDLYKQVHQR